MTLKCGCVTSQQFSCSVSSRRTRRLPQQGMRRRLCSPRRAPRIFLQANKVAGFGAARHEATHPTAHHKADKAEDDTDAERDAAGVDAPPRGQVVRTCPSAPDAFRAAPPSSMRPRLRLAALLLRLLVVWLLSECLSARIRPYAEEGWANLGQEAEVVTTTAPPHPRRRPSSSPRREEWLPSSSMWISSGWRMQYSCAVASHGFLLGRGGGELGDDELGWGGGVCSDSEGEVETEVAARAGEVRPECRWATKPGRHERGVTRTWRVGGRAGHP
jgi:hypothetical protein